MQFIPLESKTCLTYFIVKNIKILMLILNHELKMLKVLSLEEIGMVGVHVIFFKKITLIVIEIYKYIDLFVLTEF